MKSRDIARISLGVAFLSICSQISIPLPHVPITLQLFGVTLISLSMTPTQSKWIISIYILMGLIGLPVFAGFKGGIQSLLSPSFGFIIGFIVYSTILNFSLNFNRYLKMVIAYLVFYFVGLSFLYLNLTLFLDIKTSIILILKSYWLLFLPTDFISIILAYKVSQRLRIIT